MPTYKITDPASGKTLRVTGDSPPTEDELNDIFKSVGGSTAQPAPAPIGEMRRRKGEGEIAAAQPTPEQGLQQAVEQSKQVDSRSFWEKVGASEGGYQNPEESTAVAQQMGSQSVKALKTAAAVGAGIAAPELAALAAPSIFAAAPTAGVMGGIARVGSMAASGALSGAAQQTTEEALSGFPKGAGGRIGQSTLIGGGTGGAGAVAERFLPAAYQVVKNATNPRAAATTVLRPSFTKSASQLSAEEARTLIQDTTGLDVPMGVGEAVGTPELANNIKNIEAGKELAPEAKDAIKREVAFAATQLRNSGVTVNDLSKYTVNSLEAQLGRLSAPAKAAVEDVSKELHSEISSAFNKVQNDAQALVPGTAATPTTMGNRYRGHVKDAFNEIGTAEQTAWNDSKALPEYGTVKIVPKNTQAWYDSLGQKTVQQDVARPEENLLLLDQFGRTVPKESANITRPIESMFPTGTGTFGSATTKLSPEQTLEQMRNFRSQVGNSIGNNTIFPGRSDFEKKQLYKAVSTDIEDAVNALPTSALKTNLQKATALTKQRYATFDNPVLDNILKDFGGEGGIGPAGIAAKLESADAPSFLAELQKSVGPTRQAALNNDVGEYLFNQAGGAARDSTTGKVSAGKLLNNIDKLAPEIRTQFFPNYADVVALAKKEGALSKLDPKKILSNLTIDDPTLLHDALGAAPSATVTAKLKDAFAKSKALDDQLFGSVFGAIKSNSGEGISEAVAQNPERFVRAITDGSTFSPDQTRKAMGLIASENPKIIQDLQFHYVNELLSNSASEGRISASNLLKDLRGESAISKAGKLRETADAVLGDEKANYLESVLMALGEIEKAGRDIAPSMPLVDLAARGAGAAAGAATRGLTGIGTIGAANELGAIARQGSKLRYAFASWLLTTPELRKLATTPISRLDSETGRQLVNGFSNFMADKYGPDSPEADEIHTMNIDANRRGR